MTLRLRLAALGLVAALGTALLAGAAQAETVLRVGYQKYGTLVLLKERGLLEEKLKPLGVSVTWTEFPGGPQLLEALNVGAIDFGTTGEAPPIFAQAAGAPLLYVGYEPPAPKGEAILVPKDSAIQSIADLKGRKVALNKGSNVHYLLIKALEANGLQITDIEPIYLPPADARAAFERGSVDAWVIWDPFLAAAEAATGARQLANGEGLVANTQFFLAEKAFTTANPQVIDTVLAALVEVEDWAAKDTKAVAAELSPRVGIPAPILEVAIGRLTFGVKPLTPEVVAAQQEIADTFHRVGLLPKPITVSDAVRGGGS
ncbi:sulfonate ABC transporter substrate-binding protein [Zavarzinia sp. CC-PAN008]|uniref:sulfonate ABC transporter substrate-binding protein n=1 Tax=Zavarzinia sp. CC-PAN008 TaxID=3243332 RepID=UPI003F748688